MSFRKILLPFAAALATAGSPAAYAQTADVIQFWTSASESAAMSQLAGAFKERGGTWIDSPAANFDAALANALSRIAGGQPPEAFLLTPSEAMRDLARAGQLRDMSDLATANNWKAVVNPVVWDTLLVDDKVVALPVGIGSENWIWYSKPLFDQLGITEPQTIEELFVAADKLKAAGYTAFAIGGEPWQQVYILTDFIQALGGPEYWNELILKRSPEALESPIIAQSFDLFRRVSTYADAASPGRSWTDTANMIIQNKAGMQFMGDWVRGEFVAAGKKAGVDFGCMFTPTDKPTYTLVIDVLSFPTVTDPDRLAGQKLLAEVLMDPAVETKVSAAKGSVPARTDVDVSLLDECAVKGVKTLSTPGAAVVSSYDGLPGDMNGRLTDLATQFLTDTSMTTEQAVASFKQILQTP